MYYASILPKMIIVLFLLIGNCFAQGTVINGDRSIVGSLCVGSSGTPVDRLSLCAAPIASATRALLNLSNTALSGGSTAGTYIGANPAACTGNFWDFQLAGAARSKLTCAGVFTVTTFTGQASIDTLGTIVTGTWNATKIGLAYGGTNADLSATGGASQILQQSGVGSTITVGQLSASNLSNGVSGSGGVILQTSATITTPTLTGPVTLNASSGAVGLDIVGRSDHLGYLQFFKNDGVTLEGYIYGGTGKIVLGDTVDVVTITGGNVGIGTNSPGAVLHLAHSAGTAVVFERNSADAVGASFIMEKSRGTLAAPTLVSNADVIGGMIFRVYDGSGYKNAAAIRTMVDAAPGANDTPGRIVFETTPDGSTTVSERMRITSGGNVGIGATAPNEGLEMGATLNIRIPNIKSVTGVRYACINTDGTLTSQAAACVGT